MAGLELKQAARKQIKEALKRLTPDVMAKESAAIAARVLSAPCFKQAQSVGVYLHCARLREVDTIDIVNEALQQGKRVYVPVVEDKQSNMKLLHLDDRTCLVTVPPFGILEPPQTYSDGSMREDALTSQAPMQLLLMPGLGFDMRGRRLGRGGGYYDAMLAKLKRGAAEGGPPMPLTVALAYSAQLLPDVPVDQHDEPVDVLVTADAVHACSQRGAAAVIAGTLPEAG